MYVGVAIFLSRNSTYCLSQRLDPQRAFFGHWQCPGGGNERGETPIETAMRELREESGLDLPAGRFALMGEDVRNFPNGTPYLAVNFHVELTAFEEPLNREPHKATPWAWFDKQGAAVRDLIPGSFSYIERLSQLAAA